MPPLSCKFRTLAPAFLSAYADDNSYVGETARYLLAAPKSPLDRQHRVKVMFGNGLRPDVWRKFGERFGVQTVAEFFNSTEGVFALMNICSGKLTTRRLHLVLQGQDQTTTLASYSFVSTTYANSHAGEFTQGSVGHHGLVQRMSLRNVYIPVEIDHETGEMYRDPKTGFARRRPYEAGGEILVQVASEKAFVG